MKRTTIALILCLTSFAFNANADIHKIISSEDGLSNNAILSLYQDEIGHIYIGTVDGLNIWDGHTIETFQAADGYNYFYGNMIEHIYGSVSGNILVQTNYGLAGLYPKTRNVNFHSDLSFFRKIAALDQGHIFAIDENNRLHYFVTGKEKISVIPNFSLPSNEFCHQMLLSKDGRLCLFTFSNIYLLSFKHKEDEVPTIKSIQNIKLKCRFVSSDNGENQHIIITEDDELYSFCSKDCSLKHICKVSGGIHKGESISGVIQTDKGFFISFWQSGLFFLKNGESTLEPTDINYGVFSMIKDKKQPIIWVGTDCNGLICYSLESDAIHSLTYDDMPYRIKMPVRSILLDKNKNLWFGTKGNGLYRIKNFRQDGMDLDRSNMDLFTVENSGLSNNSIYSITEGRSGVIWLGTDGKGINWWSEKNERIEKVKGSEKISKIHSIIEQNDSTLWISTDGRGSYRCSFYLRNGIPVITKVDTLELSHPFDYNMPVYSIAIQNDSTIWFGSRGKGALAYNTNSGKSKIIQFPQDRGFASNEVFYISKSNQMLFATGNGLMAYSPENDSLKIPSVVPPKATHAIINDVDGNIWVSTNSGIISLDKNLNYRSSYDRFSGLKVLEYSDGACYNDTDGNLLFFGGINGITIIEKDSESTPESYSYIPDINICNFIQNNEYRHISQMMKKDKLRILYSKSIFAIQFSVVDNLHYSDYEFSYSIDGKEWVKTDSDIIYMPSLDPGHYKLRIKYLNKATSYESEERVLPIQIIPPFYKSGVAMALYLILISGLIYLTILYYKKRNAAIREKIHKKYSNEILNIKSETVGIITDELSVQITFILALCQQIRQHTQNSSVSDKVNLVEYNVAKINKMLNILNEYTGISNSFFSPIGKTLVPVSQISSEILYLINNKVGERGISMTYKIEEGLTLAINKEYFLIVLNSLANKVLSIASGSKKVHMELKRGDKGIILTSRVTCDNKRFLELDSAFINEDKEEFEIFVCRMIVDNMGGEIDCEYDNEKGIASIRIVMPAQKITEVEYTEIETPVTESINTHNTIIENELSKNGKPNTSSNHIYIISDNKDISSFIAYFLSDKYNIRVFRNITDALQKIESRMPIAVIYDISSLKKDFADFIDSLKSDRKAEHISVIAVTSSMQVTEREECIKIGADRCISFPFNIEYLHSVLEKLLLNKERIAEYYKSPLSTYSIEEGKVIHADDKIFLEKIIKYIQENISRAELTAPDIANFLGTSTRVMYRRLEGITDKKLHQIIKEMRMQQAVQYLTSSKLSIDEIMYKVGYDNRSTFYRNFKDSYGMTPKEYRDNVRENVIKSLSSDKE